MPAPRESPAPRLAALLRDGRAAPGRWRADAKRRRLEQRLREQAESRLSGILETAHDFVGSVDHEGRWTYVNEACRRIYGYAPEEMLGRSFTDLADPHQAELDLPQFHRVMSGEAVIGYETVHRRKDGSSAVLVFNGVPVRDESGQVVGATATGMDVTEARRAEADVRESRERLQEILDNCPAVVFVKDKEGRYTFANKALEEFFGRHREQILGRSDREFFPPEVAERLEAVDHEVITSNQPVRLEERVPLRDETRDFLASKFPLRDADGVPHSVCGVATDVTDVIRARELVSSYGEQQATVAAFGMKAMRGGDPAALLEEALGAVHEVLDADVVAMLDIAPAGDLVNVRAARAWVEGVELPDRLPTHAIPEIMRAFERGEPVFVRDRRADPRVPPDVAATSPASSSVSVPITTPSGFRSLFVAQSIAPREFTPAEADFLRGLAGVVGLAVERTEAEAVLEERTREIAELADARGRLVVEALEAEDHERTRLAEALHDDALQSLLAVRQDLAEAERHPADADADVSRARVTVEQTVRGLRDLVASVHPVTLSHGGLAAAVTSVAELHSGRGGFDVDVRVDADVESPHDGLVLRCARELLTNAEKHAQARQVCVSVALENGSVVLEVDDDGRGMVPGSGADAVREGHIGLASNAERVRALGGTLEIASEPGSGTNVRVALPVAPRSIG